MGTAKQEPRVQQITSYRVHKLQRGHRIALTLRPSVCPSVRLSLHGVSRQAHVVAFMHLVGHLNVAD